MADTHADRNMLLGILALQMDFVSRDQLVAGMNAWVLDKTRKLDEILLEQGGLRQDTRALLSALVDKHLEMHEGNAEKSLASLSSIGSLRDDLESIADPEIGASLSVLCEKRPWADPEATETFNAGASTSAGTRFRILRPHAKGGLGQVSVAHDSELNREVALKEIQERHADDQGRRARFVLEAEITGALEHPGIVPVYGLGSYADGRPFYAMRFIKGDSLKEAIDRYHSALAKGERNASQESLELRSLLGRFIDVCQAIEYAHSRGVLHRDLKPGNIMLGKYGETLVVDWGLAKPKGRYEDAKVEGENTLKPRSGSSLAQTQMGSAIGTPTYMPPEQAAGRLDELGPASDVYSLGATLYCLLTGRTPIEGKDAGEILKKVQAGDFVPPRTIKHDIPKPLESICLRAMAVKPRNRYASPQALADDVERFLADEPVTSHSEPFTVRARRWMRKHPRSVTALAATLLVGVTSTIVIAAVVSGKNQQLAAANSGLDRANTQLTEKNVELKAANQAERQATETAEAKRIEAEQAREDERLAKQEAETRRQESEAVLNFFQNRVLAAARPEGQVGGLGINATIRAAVDAAEPQIADSFADRPLVEASIRHTLGSTYYYLGEAQLAIRQFEHARRLRQSTLGPDHPATLASMGNLALAYKAAGQLDEALPIYEEALKASREILGPDHPDTLMSMDNLALCYLAAGRLDDALPLHQEALKVRKEILGPDHHDTLVSMNNLALSYGAAGRMDEAITLHEQTLALMKQKLGPEHPNTLRSMHNLAQVYQTADRPDEALTLNEETLKLMKEILGPDHLATLASMGNLAAAYRAVGRLDEAITLHEQTLKRKKEQLGLDHPQTLGSMNSLALAYRAAGRLDEALTLDEQTLKLVKEKLGPDHPATLTSMNNLAMGYRAAGRLDDALPLLQETLKASQEILGPDHPDTLTSMDNLAETCLSAEKPEKALPIYDQRIAASRRRAKADDPQFAGMLARVASTLLQHQQHSAAETYLRECLSIREKAMADHWLLFNTQSLLGGAISGQGAALLASEKEAALRKFTEAEPLLIAGYEGMKQREGTIPAAGRVHLTEALRRLVDLYTAWDKPDGVAKWQAELDKRPAEPAAE